MVLAAEPAAEVAPGGMTTLAIRFRPLVEGGKKAAVVITTNDPDESRNDIGWYPYGGNRTLNIQSTPLRGTRIRVGGG